MEELKKSIKEIVEQEILKVVISNKKDKDEVFNKIVISLKENSKNKYYQVEKYTDKQVFHENIELDTLENKILEYMESKYKQLSAWATNMNFDLKISKKNKVFLGKKRSDNSNIIVKGHNKEKNYILKEGKVVNSQYDKYKQINRFIEIIDDEVKKNNFEELTILDFGCGKSYLTFVLYYYFTEIKKINVKMIGLDLKADVIKKCNDIAKKYKYENLKFELGDINGFKYNNKVDMVITLHACDTATDYALYNAIKWNTKMIFSVPCCQHELNSQMKPENLPIVSKYGIVKERVSALMTDAIRANLLECLGYKTQLLEFIDIAHSPKNILIRASKSNISKDKKEKSLSEVNDLIKEFNFNPTLYKLLKEDNLI